ncbi:uncharacterized protein LOC114940988 [Nylanderia fulva]|uniref:uncharacterized protein LOC114940988 n=1 Tax=Nylanderia fulva TaxID=613905 RepID=UPI0010FB82A0|nr:uncharacterized protein LOC114940988 [Nylanderia fulva]
MQTDTRLDCILSSPSYCVPVSNLFFFLQYMLKMDHKTYCFDSQYQTESYYGQMQCDSENEHKNENFCEIENEINENEIDGDALLIALVHDHPYLYNKELTDFKDQLKKLNAWSEIAIVLNMTADECQSRWTRLRERYTREKKQRQEETTTGSGASKRKTFEFFNNMQFLDPFVKKRRTMTNVHAVTKNSPLTKRYISFQKNFSSNNEKENLPLNASILIEQNSSKVNIESLEQNRFNSNSSGRNEVNISSTATLSKQSFTDINSAHLRDSTSLLYKSSDAVASPYQSDASSVSVLSACDYATKKGLNSKIKSKGKSQPDVANAISKVTSLLENKYSSPVSTVSSSLKPEVEEDVAFCQLILSSLTKMQGCKKEKKKDILRIIYDI